MKSTEYHCSTLLDSAEQPKSQNSWKQKVLFWNPKQYDLEEPV